MSIPFDPSEWARLLADLRNPDDIDRSVAAREAIDQLADESWLPALHELLETGENFYIRESAAMPIIFVEGLRALPSLLHAYQRARNEGHDNDGFTEGLAWLIQTHATEAMPLIGNMLNDPDPQRRADAEWLLDFARDTLNDK